MFYPPMPYRQKIHVKGNLLYPSSILLFSISLGMKIETENTREEVADVVCEASQPIHHSVIK